MITAHSVEHDVCTTAQVLYTSAGKQGVRLLTRSIAACVTTQCAMVALKYVLRGISISQRTILKPTWWVYIYATKYTRQTGTVGVRIQRKSPQPDVPTAPF